MMTPPPGFTLETEEEQPQRITPPPGFTLEANEPFSPLPERNNATWGDVPANAIGELEGMAKSGMDAVKNLTPFGLAYNIPQNLQSLKDPRTNPVWQALPHPTVEEGGKIGFDAGGLARPYLNVAKDVIKGQPFETFKKEPVSTTLAFAPFMGPVARGVSKIPGVSQATSIFKNVASVPAKVGKKVFSGAFDVPEEAIASRFKDPRGIRTAQSAEEIAMSLPKEAGKFDQAIKGLHDRAETVLSKSPYLEKTATDVGGAFTKDEILGTIKSARRELGGIYTDQGKAAARTLDNISSDLGKIRNTVSQNQVHDLIKRLDMELRPAWKKLREGRASELTLEENSMIGVRTRMDKALKSKNLEYGKFMQPMEDLIQSRNEFLKTFGIKKEKGGGYYPTDVTSGKVSGATKDSKLFTKSVLGKVKENIGSDIFPRIEKSGIKEAFEPKFKPSSEFYEATKAVLGGPPTAGKIIDTVSEAMTAIKSGNTVKKLSEIMAVIRRGISEGKNMSPLINALPRKIKQNGIEYPINEQTGEYE